VETAYYGVEGEPVLCKDTGAARAVSRYDERGNVVEAAYYGVDGRPILLEYIGARAKYAYDENDQMIGLTYEDEYARNIPLEVEVAEIVPGSTAARIGLEPGDRLLAYSGKILTCKEQLIASVTQPGPDLRTLTMRRGEETMAFQVPPGRLGVNIRNVRALGETAVAQPPSLH
jgi:S1-C subfamily serine protease